MIGTCLQGYVETTYDELLKAFGKPLYGPDDEGGDKVTCEWEVKSGVVVATIYDYKLGYTPRGKYLWHVGGHSLKSVVLVQDMLKKSRESAQTREMQP